MEYRIGKCSACGAEFKVPASFAHDVARCKVCSGVVHLGQPGEPAPSTPPASSGIPAKRVVQREPVEVTTENAEEKRAARGTLARLKAQRAAEASGAAAPVPAAAQPSAASRPATPSTPAPAAAKPGRPAGAKSSPSRARAGRPSAARKRGGRSRAGDDGAGESKRRGARQAPAKKKSPLVPLLGVLGIVVIAAAAYFFMQGGDEGESKSTSNEVAAAETDVPAEVEAPEATDDATRDPAPVEAAPEAAAEEGEEGDEDVAADEGEAPAEDAPKKVETVDISDLEDCKPGPGTTDEEWAQMNEWATTMMDPYAGAAGPRAEKKLIEMKYKAFPVVVNHMKGLDMSTDDGYRAGFSGQRVLTELLNGHNFDWKNQDEEYYVEFNKKVIRSYATLVWAPALVDIEAWIRAAKLDDKDPEHAAELRQLYGEGGAAPEEEAASEPEVGADDLDVD